MRQKKAKTDFREMDLPKNRWELFFDSFKNRHTTFFGLGLLLLIFAIPFVIIVLISDFNSAQIWGLFNNGEMTEEEYLTTYTSFLVMQALLLIPAIMIFSIGLSGAVRVVRQIVWQEGVFFREDFFLGIKQNFKGYLTAGFLFGLLNFLNVYISNAFFTTNTAFGIIKTLPTGFTYIVFFPAILLSLMMVPIYSSKYFACLKNSFILYLKTAPKTFVATLCLYSALLIKLLPNPVIKFFVLVLFIIILLPLYMMGYFLYSTHIFDKQINVNYYPEIVDKGIYRTEEERENIKKKSQEFIALQENAKKELEEEMKTETDDIVEETTLNEERLEETKEIKTYNETNIESDKVNNLPESENNTSNLKDVSDEELDKQIEEERLKALKEMEKENNK